MRDVKEINSMREAMRFMVQHGLPEDIDTGAYDAYSLIKYWHVKLNFQNIMTATVILENINNSDFWKMVTEQTEGKIPEKVIVANTNNMAQLSDDELLKMIDQDEKS